LTSLLVRTELLAVILAPLMGRVRFMAPASEDPIAAPGGVLRIFLVCLGLMALCSAVEWFVDSQGD
jgi:hypothetical protein